MRALVRIVNKRCAATLVCLGGLVTGCADTPPAPIETRSAVVTPKQSDQPRPVLTTPSDHRPDLVPGQPYTVEQGDTLYSIAFRLGADYRALAQVNGIAAPYTIYPGQRLETVTGTGPTRAPKSRAESQGAKPTAPAVSGAAVTPTRKPDPAPAPKAVSASKAKASTPTAKVAPAQPKAAASASAKASPASSKALGPVSRWLWPGKGAVQRAFSDVLHKGIDIAGQRGDPVYATASGVVVYAGTGVKGYGALLIVKHNDQFLSAYGHNDAMLVAEGTSISAGQQIARMGSSGTDTVKLHFEIRRQGQPVDPLRLLPKR